MRNWKIKTIAECSTILGDGLHGTPKYDKLGEYAFINGNNLNNGYILIKPDTKRISLSEYEKYKKNLTDRTVLVSINGTLGNVAVYRGEKIILGKSACYFNVAENCDVQFMRYVVSTPQFQQYIHSVATGTTIKNVSLKQMREYAFPCPNLFEQQRIARILYLLDKKIETNSKINDNLHVQAKTLFNKRFLKIDSVPHGWKKGNLLDIANYLNGLPMQKYRPQEGEVAIPVLKIKELRQGMYDSSSEQCSPNIKSEYIIKDGDIIFSWSGSLLIDIWCGGTCGLNQHLFKVTSDIYDKWFYYLWTSHYLDKFIAIAADKATTMGHIKRGDLAKAEILVPSKEDYEEIRDLMNPIFELIIETKIESRKLTELRNALLPRLMSGEIDVSEISI